MYIIIYTYKYGSKYSSIAIKCKLFCKYTLLHKLRLYATLHVYTYTDLILTQVLSARSWDEKNNLTSFRRDHGKKEKPKPYRESAIQWR